MIAKMRGPLLVLLLAFAAPARAASPGDEIPRFEATAVKGGKSLTVVSSRRSRPTVYLFVGTQCDATAAYLGRMRELERAYADRVDFVYLYPNRTESSQQKLAFHQEKQLTGAAIDDRGARIARLLDAHRTAETFVVRRDGRIAYHGAIDDDRSGRNIKRRHLALALDEVLAGKPVSTPETAVNA